MSDGPPSRRPLVVAHRGASVDCPENTVEAFMEARSQGADWVELDVRVSADDVLVVHHDAHYADGRLVREVAMDEVPDHVPSLAEAFEACDGMGVNIEVKNLPGDPDHEASVVACEAVAGLASAYRPPELLLVRWTGSGPPIRRSPPPGWWPSDTGPTWCWTARWPTGTVR